MKNLPFDITIFLSPKIFFTEVQGVRFTCTTCTVFFHVQFSFMYSFLSPSLSPLLSFSPFSFIFLSCYFSCNVLSPLLSFSRFFPIPFFPPPPSSTCIPVFLTFYLLTPPHLLRFSIFFSFFPRVFIFPSISNPYANLTFFFSQFPYPVFQFVVFLLFTLCFYFFLLIHVHCTQRE